MIELIPFDAPNLIGFRINGSIDDDGFRRAAKKIEAMLEYDRPIRVYAEIEILDGVSLQTFFENLKFKFQLFGQLEKFEKEAIVSDKRWVETLVNIGDSFFPSVEVKHFTFDEQDEALRWIRRSNHIEY